MKYILFRIGFLVMMILATIRLQGQSVVSGTVYEQDSISTIEGATISFSGITELGDTLLYQFFSDTIGFYEADIEAGVYQVSAFADGYETTSLPDSLMVVADTTLVDVNFVLHELLLPVRYVAARHYAGDLVRLSWSMYEPRLYEDFETGDFGKFSWDNTISGFPWAIDSTQAYEGSCCMKSTCEGQDNGLSEIEVSVYVPLAGEMSFFSKVSSEASWDVGLFYIDGVKLMELSGNMAWEEHRFAISEGEHTFRWSYRKDASTNDGDDCFYVDCIHFYEDANAKCPIPKQERSFQYYDLYRSRFDEQPVMLVSHLTDTMFMEMNWSNLPWGQYRWGVSCYYEGNRGVSDTIWSAFLDKEMTTQFVLEATTNVGLSAEGAQVYLDSEGFNYQCLVGSDGSAILPDVYRGSYTLRVHLDGYVDYISDTLVSVMEPTQVEIMLEEALNCVDSLYVSSTGWAMWHVSDTLNRGLQYFEIQLDSMVVGNTSSTFFQLDVDGLVAGNSYLVQVRPVYLSGSCGWAAFDWIYHPCSDFPASINGLQWSVNDEKIVLSWQYPENDSVMGCRLYRNGDYMGYTEADFFVDEEALLQDDLDYCIRMVYGGDFDGGYYSMSCEECVIATFPAYCDPPTKLEAENYYESESDFGTLVYWGDRPAPIYQWLQYDNGVYKNSIGGGDETVIFWSVRFDAEDLIEYQDTELKKISLFDISAGSYQLWVYVGGDLAPRTMVMFQEMTLNGSFSWHEQTITPAIEIPENEPVWIVVGQQGLSRPAAACDDMGDQDGRWVSLNGTEWHDLHYYNMYYTWMLRAFVSNRRGEVLPIGNDGFSLYQYNLYRSYNNVDYQQIASVPAVEGLAYYQYRDVLTDNPNDRFFYKLTALYYSEEGEECESDYAASLYYPDQNYVVVDNHWKTAENQVNGLNLYPNPTSDVVFVEAEAMSHVKLFNAMGQCVMDKDLAGSVLQIDLSSYSEGVYLLSVTTKKAILSRRFVLSR